MVPLLTSIPGHALTNILTIGSTVAVAGLIQLLWENGSPSWLNILAAIWLFVSLFIFTVRTPVAWNEAVAAFVIFLTATWDALELNHIRTQHHMRS